MTVLVPGFHLLDEETYACAGLQKAFTRLDPDRDFVHEFAEMTRRYTPKHRKP